MNNDTTDIRGVNGSPLTFADVTDREWALGTEEARLLLDSLPQRIRHKFIRCFLSPNSIEIREVLDFFLRHSDIAKIIHANPGSAEAFEYLYKREAFTTIDKYFLASKAGSQVYKRLVALETTLPEWINKVVNGNRLLVDNIGSGPGRDMLGVLERNPDILDKTNIRNIDPDARALDIGEGIANELGVIKSCSFICKKVNEVEPRSADLILLIGILCPLKRHICRHVLKSLIPYSRPGGLIIFSTAQNRMVLDDPLTDFIMRFTGWHMEYKTDKEAHELALSSGWEPIAQFFDEPYRFHCMTVAKLTKNSEIRVKTITDSMNPTLFSRRGELL